MCNNFLLSNIEICFGKKWIYLLNCKFKSEIYKFSQENFFNLLKLSSKLTNWAQISFRFNITSHSLTKLTQFHENLVEKYSIPQ